MNNEFIFIHIIFILYEFLYLYVFVIIYEFIIFCEFITINIRNSN